MRNIIDFGVVMNYFVWSMGQLPSVGFILPAVQCFGTGSLAALDKHFSG